MRSKWSIIFQKAQSHISMCLVQNWNNEEIHVAVGLVSAISSLDFRLDWCAVFRVSFELECPYLEYTVILVFELE